ncbi:hypothetical protein Mic7113_4160 [Allocoleopsis franciscana PCC 7113]|uniref:Uncharacterized protein n=1 Tax=Allocoleopsis franciscana PCC 7113 TaxID=1173027 RepID=K9WJ70_9CYAN|nr:hypothetical protein Mic7113_4160 [Allocoleopsis franciscana PCC 7113]
MFRPGWLFAFISVMLNEKPRSINALLLGARSGSGLCMTYYNLRPSVCMDGRVEKYFSGQITPDYINRLLIYIARVRSQQK